MKITARLPKYQPGVHSAGRLAPGLISHGPASGIIPSVTSPSTTQPNHSQPLLPSATV